ncbi:MAG: hypothetical protein V2J26_08870 [Pacificimonas sp.]|nr:hypothetical protein [Pacificimonas sp.]
MKSRLSVAAALLAVAACSGEADEPAGGGEVSSSTADVDGYGNTNQPEPVVPADPTGWTYGGLGPQSETLAYADGTGGVSLYVRCLPDPARLQVETPYLMPIESEERLTLGIGDRLVVMVAEPAAGIADMEDRGVVAEAPLDAELVAALSGGDFAVSYGAEILEAPEVPGDDALTRFANGCAAALAEGSAIAEQR